MTYAERIVEDAINQYNYNDWGGQGLRRLLRWVVAVVLADAAKEADKCGPHSGDPDDWPGNRVRALAGLEASTSQKEPSRG